MLRIFRRLCGGLGDRDDREVGEKQVDSSRPNQNSTAEVKMTQVPSSREPARIAYQPLHESVREAYDPEYVAFHDRYVQFVEPEHLIDWTPGIRSRSLWPYSGSPILQTGGVEDVNPNANFAVRIFRPQDKEEGLRYPLILWFHGGGFVGGNIDSDNDLCSLLCRSLSCVVVNVDYRLAPEHPYPAAIEDVTEILKWVSSEAGVQKLGIDRSKIVIGGASAGANLATVGALMAADLSIRLTLQLLVVPVTDNSATSETSWSSHPHAAGLTPPRMTWYRNLYLKNVTDVKDWRVSPLYASEEAVSKLPKTWIAIAGQDMLSTEGLAYADRLKKAGVATEVRIYDGVPHSMMALSGRRCMDELVDATRRHFASF